MEGVRIAAISDPDSACLGRASQRLPDATAFRDASEMMSDARLNAIVIAHPPMLHADTAVEGFGRGLDVYVEKPMAPGLDDAARIVHAWRSSGRVGMIGFNYRFNPLFVELRRRVLQGDIGSVIAVRSTYSAPRQPLPPWKESRDTGGGVLLDRASHHVDMIRFVTGLEAQTVSAVTRSRYSDEDSAVLTTQLEGGVDVQSFFSLTSIDEDRIEIYGTTGKLAVDRMSSLGVESTPPQAAGGRRLGTISRRVVATAAGAPHLIAKLRSPLNEPSFKPALEHFVDCIRRGSQPSPDLDDGYASLAIIDAAKQSAECGSTVAVRKSLSPAESFSHFQRIPSHR